MGDDEQQRPRYATDRDAIEQGIIPALDGDGYDFDAIFREAYIWKIDVNDRGQELLNTGGFEQAVTDEQFWVIVQRHTIC